MYDTYLRFRLTQNEKDKIKAKAKKANLTVSEYLRKSALNKKIKTIQGLADIIKLRTELKRIGTNINQITKQLNQNKSFESQDKVAFLNEINTLKSHQKAININLSRVLEEL